MNEENKNKAQEALNKIQDFDLNQVGSFIKAAIDMVLKVAIPVALIAATIYLFYISATTKETPKNANEPSYFEKLDQQTEDYLKSVREKKALQEEQDRQKALEESNQNTDFPQIRLDYNNTQGF